MKSGIRVKRNFLYANFEALKKYRNPFFKISGNPKYYRKSYSMWIL